MSYDLVKVFDLSGAPAELRESDDLQLLKPTITEPAEATLLLFNVGSWHANDGSSATAPTQEVTYAEYLLHQWLSASGAVEGETVLVTWNRASSVLEHESM